MGETNSPSVAHVGYDISPLSRVKFKILTTRLMGKKNLFLLSPKHQKYCSVVNFHG
jgi:hypothetical protein